MSNLFSGLEELGFGNLKNIDIFNDAEKAKSKKQEKDKEESQIDMLYDKTYDCPVCCTQFKSKTVKTGKARLVKLDTDFMPIYDKINPLFYDVIICPRCGYGAMINYFNKIRQFQVKLVLDNITTKYKPKTYPDVYDIDVAIERFKYSLLNSIIKDAKNSEKAYNCLKIAWMYRLKGDTINENKFLEQAFIGLRQAFETESPPYFGVDQFSLMYLIGECARRLGNDSEALIWFGKVIVSNNVKPKLKDLAREQKDIIKNSKPDAN